MAYNNGFPMNYQQFYPQYQQTPMPVQQSAQTAFQVQQQAQSQNMIWVQGEAGAKSYLVGPNTTVQLWDSEAQTIYLKSADASGMPSMKILDYTIRDNQQTQIQSPVQPPISESPVPVGDYVTQEEFKAFERDMKKQISSLKKGGRDDD